MAWLWDPNGMICGILIKIANSEWLLIFFRSFFTHQTNDVNQIGFHSK